MTQQILNLGNGPNTHTGDNLPTMGGKVNANFTELYSGSGPAANGGVFRSVLTDTFTLTANATTTTVTVPEMLATSLFEFIPQVGNQAASQAWQWIWVVSQVMAGINCVVTLNHPSQPSSTLTYTYKVTI